MGQVSSEEDIQRRAEESEFMAGRMQPDLQQIYLAATEKPHPTVNEELISAKVAVPKPRMSRIRDRTRVADPLLRRANAMQRLWGLIRDGERKRRPIIVD